MAHVRDEDPARLGRNDDAGTVGQLIRSLESLL
jgi:hypothetical protein